MRVVCQGERKGRKILCKPRSAMEWEGVGEVKG